MVIGAFRRKWHLACWLLRYWVLDKYHEQARMVALAGATVVVVLSAWGVLGGAWQPRATAAGGDIPPAVQAVVWWAYLIMLVVSAVIAWALAPKPETPKPVEGKTPVVKDGKAIVRIYGEEWIDDSGIAAPFGDVDPEPIRKKAGKK